MNQQTQPLNQFQERPSFIQRVKSSITRTFSCKRTLNGKWCGRKRQFHQTLFNFGKRAQSVNPIINVKPNITEPVPQPIIFQQPIQRINRSTIRGSLSNRESLLSNRELIDFTNSTRGQKRQKLDNSNNSYKSFFSDHRFNTFNTKSSMNPFRDLNQTFPNANGQQFQTPQQNQIEHNILQVRDLRKLDDIISSKKKEIEQLEQLKEQRLLQSQVNQVQIEESMIENGHESHHPNQSIDFLRGPNSRSLHLKQFQKSEFNLQMNGNNITAPQIEQPNNRQQLFNVSNISLIQGNSNLNTSYDTAAHNDFSIPMMLPRRNQNINSSSQTKYTLDSFLEEPMPFRTHLKVSNFNLQKNTQQQLEDQNELENGHREQGQIFTNLDIKKPQTEDVELLSLPNLDSKAVQYIINEILNISKEGDQMINCLSSSTITVKDLRKLCQRNSPIQSKIVSFYIKLLQSANSKNLFANDVLDFGQEEWQNFVQRLCASDEYHQKLIFTSITQGENKIQDLTTYIICNNDLKVTQFVQPESNNISYALSAQQRFSRMKELIQMYSQKLQQERSLFSSSIMPKPEINIEQKTIKLFEEEEQFDLGVLMFMYQLRQSLNPITLGTNASQQWKKVEQMIRDPQYNDYFRFSIAMELIPPQKLLQ